MGTSQIIMLVLLITNLLFGLYYHGKERTGNYSFWVTLIIFGIYFTLLMTGGYFN